LSDVQIIVFCDVIFPLHLKRLQSGVCQLWEATSTTGWAVDPKSLSQHCLSKYCYSHQFSELSNPRLYLHD